MQSRLLQARGLKCSGYIIVDIDEGVAPLAGAWIEMTLHRYCKGQFDVAPLAGAWIEIICHDFRRFYAKSRLLQARGLKYLVMREVFLRNLSRLL